MKADLTVPGGLYLDLDGKGYHDANGRPVSVEDAKKLFAALKVAQEKEESGVEAEVVVTDSEGNVKDFEKEDVKDSEKVTTKRGK